MTDPILTLNNISITFPHNNGGLDALEHVSFEVYPQEFVCVVGPSGSGKTTLLRILAGLRSPTEGEVTFKSIRIEGPRHGIGIVFQSANLMPWRTVLENIILPFELEGGEKEAVKTQALDLIQLVGLAGFEDTYPRDLSGGMAQRVAIARALAHDPALLLLDEPFGALDALTREYMRTELLRIWQARRKTVIMVTHSIDEAIFLADRVIVLSDRPGKVIHDIAVDFPRPRDENLIYTREFSVLARKVRGEIRKGLNFARPK